MDPAKTVYWLKTALLCCDGPGASDGESDMEDGVTAAESMEGESAWGSDGGDATEDSGVGVLDGEGEITRLPPPINGAGEGDSIAEAISRQLRIRNPRTFEIDISKWVFWL